jgi:signal-transduction protein with cAMP-binding, CBS, and nucleotidyltransferase domain
MILKQLIYPKNEEYYNNELLTEANAGVRTVFGTVFLKKGTRIPEEGFSRHPFNEVSIIIKGCIEMLNEDGLISGYLKEGTAVFINALEPQAGNVLEDTKLIYVLNQKI